jgi:hypothetical protein
MFLINKISISGARWGFVGQKPTNISVQAQPPVREYP